MNAPYLLDTHTSWAYAGLTFPRYRYLLDSGKAAVVAVGADLLGQPIGLALAWHDPDAEHQTANVLSVSVKAAYRRQGLGTALLARLEAELARRGAQQVRGEYPADRPGTPATERILAAAGWNTPRLDRLVCMTDLPTIVKAPWMHDYQLPDGFETFPWADLPDADAEHLRRWLPTQSHRVDWEEDGLSPFSEKRGKPAFSSLGLRHRGEVVGWMLTDRTTPDTIRYDRLFVAHHLRPLGLGVMLLATSIWTHFHAEGHLVPPLRGVWQTLATNRPMIAFIRRRMAPYLTGLTEVYAATKQLAQEHTSQPTLNLEEPTYV